MNIHAMFEKEEIIDCDGLQRETSRIFLGCLAIPKCVCYTYY